MEIFKKYKRRAKKLVEKLQKEVDKNPSVICENYGQKEIRKFITELEKLPYGSLTYLEVCDIKDILYKVADIH